jgi:hypothetical protein
LIICLIPVHVYAGVDTQPDADNNISGVFPSLDALESYWTIYYQSHPDSVPPPSVLHNTSSQHYLVTLTVPDDQVSNLSHSSSQFKTDQKFGDTGCPYDEDEGCLCREDLPNEVEFWGAVTGAPEVGPFDLYTSDCSVFTLIESKYPDSTGWATFTVNINQPGGILLE